MKIRIQEQSLLGIFFFLLTFSGSLFCNEYGMTTILEYMSYGILFFLALKKYSFRVSKKSIFSYIVLFLFIVGILLQNLRLFRRIILCFTMFVIWVSVFKLENLIREIKTLRLISRCIILAVILSFILCLLTNLPITDDVYDTSALIKLGFNGGIKHKNYFAADLLVVFVGYFFSYKYNVGYKKRNMMAMITVALMILLSGSRGSYYILLAFLIVSNIDKLKYIKASQKKLLAIAMTIVGIIGFVIAYKNIAMNSSTYMYRLRGFTNYLNHFYEDGFHLIFGNAESFFDTELEYVYAVRSVVGWDGTLEFSWVNVLIKNGFLGIIGFILIFIYYANKGINSKEQNVKNIIFPVLIMLIISSFVETYMQTIHNPFGVFCYMAITGFLCKRRKFNYGVSK